MYQAFIDFLDTLYWEGYARQLAEDNPEAFQFELNQFFDNYKTNELCNQEL